MVELRDPIWQYRPTHAHALLGSERMATIKEAVTLRFITTKDGDVEEKTFDAGESVEIMETWDDHYLVKDDDGHLFNVQKSLVEG